LALWRIGSDAVERWRDILKHLRTLLGDYPHTNALLTGKVSDPDIRFDFAKVSGRLPFKDFVREHKFDIGELPLIPLLQARELGKPFVLVPVVLLAQFQHRSAYVLSDSGIHQPSDLNGRRIGMRSDAQTGPDWALGIFVTEHGVDRSSLQILIFEDPHIAEYVPPSNVSRAKPGRELVQSLIDGEIDAIVTDFDLTNDARLRPLLPDYAEQARKWHQRTGIVPVGHILAVSAELSASDPDLIHNVYRLFNESKKLAPIPGDKIDAYPMGSRLLKPALEMMIDFAVRLKLIRRHLTVEELYDDTTRMLVDPAS
jgi:4,5-dihydroxyphthalate decarboxylase